MIKRFTRKRRQRQDGQSLVEFALAFPILAIFVFGVIYLSLVLITYYSETRMVRESTRWLSVRSATTDDLAFAQHVQDTLLPGMVGGIPVLHTCTGPELAADPVGCTDTIYDVGKMRVWFTPCTMSGGRCSHINRYAAKTLHVAMQYDMSNLFFLPSEFRIGLLSVPLPTQLPKYRVSVMVE